MIVVTAPSGAGKSTIVKHILQKFDEVSFSISATTRERRQTEKEGEDYYFISPEKFREMITQGEFVEWEEVYKNQFYGTLKSEVERIWNKGKHIIFDIDVHGAIDIKNEYPDALTIFIKPPSFEDLLERLIKRGTDNEHSLKKRIERIRRELTFENRFDRILLNDDLDEALTQSEQIVNGFLND